MPGGWATTLNNIGNMTSLFRARLARNLSTSPFAPKATLDHQEHIIDQVLGAAQQSEQMGNAAFYKVNTLQGNERRLLVERHLISPALAESKGQRGLLFNPDESLSVMINEEDHLRLQAILPGLQTMQAWHEVNALDAFLNVRRSYTQGGANATTAAVVQLRQYCTAYWHLWLRSSNILVVRLFLYLVCLLCGRGMYRTLQF